MDPKLKTVIKAQFPKLRVLLVDDMPQNIKNNVYFLSQMGFERNNITFAKDGLQGLLKLTSFKPDLILTDWNMPMTDGLQMVRKIRGTKAFAGVPIIMITAEADKDVETAKPFCEAVLKKPYTMKDVEEQIFTALAGYFLRRLKEKGAGAA